MMRISEFINISSKLASLRALPTPLFTFQYIHSNRALSSIRFKGNLYMDASQKIALSSGALDINFPI